jgi:hypothetical protein
VRRMLYLAVGVLTAFTLVLVPSTANAAQNITSMGGPLNMLPSAAKSAAGSYSSQEYLAAYLYKASKSPAFWEAYEKAKATSASTGKALVLSSDVAAEAKTIYPATKAAGLVKGAGAVGAGIGFYQMAGQLTNGALDLAGLDATGTVCSGTGRDLWGTIVQTAASVSCADYDKIPDDFEPNTDASGQYTMQPIRDAVGHNVAYEGTWTAPNGADRQYSCFTLSENTDQSGGIFVYIKAPNFTSGTQLNFGPRDGFPAPSLGGPICGGIGSEDGKSVLVAYLSDGWGIPIRGMSFDGKTFSDGAEGSSDPLRTLKCVILGTDGKTYTGESDQFRETSGVLPNVKCADLPADVLPASTKIVETGADSGDQTIWEASSDPAVLDALQSGCGTSTGTQCQLLLYKDGESCYAGADCQGWFKDPDKSKYRCEYGGKTVSLSECTTLAPRWEPEQIRKGDTLGDPDTGKPLTNPKPALDPSSDAGTGSAPVTEPGSGEPCWSTSWGVFNPLTWVYRPIQCAAQWAFVPRSSEISKAQDSFEKTYKKTAPAQLGTAVGGWDFHPIATGCSGLTVPWSKVFGHDAGDWHLFSACAGEPLEPVKNAGVIFLGLLFIAGGGLGAYRIVGSTIKIAKIGSL